MPHHDARRALHDPNPPPRPSPLPGKPITLDVSRIAAQAAAGIGRRPREEWATLERLHTERLLDRLEEHHEPADVDATVLRFVEAVRAALAA